MNRQDIFLLVLGLVFFAVAMAFRSVSPYGWMRAALAGAAFILLGLVIYRLQKRNNHP